MADSLTTPTTRDALAEHARFVARLARSLTVDPNEADDLVQEAWLIALRQRPRPDGLRPWLASVVRKVAHTRRRARYRRQRREVRVAREEAIADTTTLLADLELRHAVVAAVLALEAPYREVLVRHYDRELTLREIAEEDGVPLETVRSRHRRSLARLRESLTVTLGSGGLGALALLAERHRPLLQSASAGTLGSAGSPMGLLAAGVVAAAVVYLGGARLLDEGGARGRGIPPPPALEGPPGTERSAKRMAASPGQDPEPASERSPESRAAASPALARPASSPPRTSGASRGQAPPVGGAPHPLEAFWQAVVTAYEKGPHYSPADPASRKKLPGGEPIPPIPRFSAQDESLDDLLARLRQEQGLPIKIDRRVVQLGLRPLTFALDQPHAPGTLLDFLIAESGFPREDDVYWTFEPKGIFQVLTSKRDKQHESHGIGDLQLEPGDFFPAGADQAPLFPALGNQDLATLIEAVVAPGTWTRGRTVKERKGRLEVDHRPGVQLEVRELLDHLRRFYVPFDQGRIPGRSLAPFRREDPVADATLARLRRQRIVIGWNIPFGPDELRNFGELLERQLELDVHVAADLEATDLPVRMETRARSGLEFLDELQDASTGLRWSMVGDIVRIGHSTYQGAPGEHPGPVAPYDLALYDLRPLWSAQPGGTRAGDSPDSLRGDGLADHLRRRFAPATWETDPEVKLWVLDSGVLIVHHAPGVVRAIRQHLDELRGLAKHE